MNASAQKAITDLDGKLQATGRATEQALAQITANASELFTRLFGRRQIIDIVVVAVAVAVLLDLVGLVDWVRALIAARGEGV